MSRLLFCSMLLLALAASDTNAADATTQTGLKQGDPIGVFYVTKIAGAEDDGVDTEQEICYRCRYGSRPMVMVFARQTDGKVTELVKQLDSAVTENQDARLSAFVSLLGEDTGKLKTSAIELAKKTSAKQIPFVVAKESKTGPLNYRLAIDAPVTVVVANDSQVVSSRAFATDEIDLDAILADVKAMLN
ncbi:hypothetical protein Pla52o_17780 [Novipirellula galeiformis]|uniref:Thioredoxin domain-containing protein n=1 Tax=Novipirellula galeiformis TaxID=2528004 RepID=A0A5C6CID7_9BACT|nr:hypothetical protein [Novipirellula galeiformis]TWU23855.1 hypothetical protein Pla52o_17780 [Novipirellula galeiformis]